MVEIVKAIQGVEVVSLGVGNQRLQLAIFVTGLEEAFISPARKQTLGLHPVANAAPLSGEPPFPISPVNLFLWLARWDNRNATFPVAERNVVEASFGYRFLANEQTHATSGRHLSPDAARLCSETRAELDS
ncbi:hypothetical protein EN746_36095 [Mesorhizobium sp. M8A.F.Ca.ET.023.02.2.1]|nr:hypothetical protein EN746_36095 [Mesorhizobium sp. M8A.F.Ca.ET.023.02.2.1]